jgi:hypothetical protein
MVGSVDEDEDDDEHGSPVLLESITLEVLPVCVFPEQDRGIPQ